MGRSVGRTTAVWPATIAACCVVSAIPAWGGGGGGADLGSVLQALTGPNGPCAKLHVTNCPQLPTINQVIVEYAALLGVTPNIVRTTPSLGINIPPGRAIDAGSLAGLSNPLAFISTLNNQGKPTPSQASNPAVNSFLSATTTPTGSPTTLDLTFDFRSRTLGFAPAQEGLNIGQITLPLVVADINRNASPSDLSIPHLATLEVFADPNTCPTCVTTDIMADLTGTTQTYQLSQLGISFLNDNSNSNASQFSPNEAFTVDIPLLIPADLQSAYTFSASGHQFVTGLFDGIDPVANFLDASFLDNANNLLSAAHADLAIARTGGTILSDPVSTAEPATLALVGSGLAGLAFLRRRRRAAD
jgi:PEP-CTERM motif